uniref:Uncharacterized protein n=1 Tax=Brassica oleracea var. oleracea TaxID=109376 RepID=A0A0D3B9G6_BRAOL
MAFVTTAEVCDANQDLIRSGQLRALQPCFQIYGRRQIFSGPVVTVKVFEDNGLIRQFLEEKDFQKTQHFLLIEKHELS